MGFGVTELLIILAIVLVLFGAKKLRNVGGDLGGAIKNFKQAMNDDDDKDKNIVINNNSSDAIENKGDATFDQGASTKTKESV
jgi:sec-independent protein translocase protein TatA